ncbi:hypothetical protein QCA50_018077 [Cerrena zonata]|uniref:Uncharacterized protein n=1 Tax=Cerrena zonata TaxID=2478898 RepID=A0AAW0FFB8_9APHY
MRSHIPLVVLSPGPYYRALVDESFTLALNYLMHIANTNEVMSADPLKFSGMAKYMVSTLAHTTDPYPLCSYDYTASELVAACSDDPKFEHKHRSNAATIADNVALGYQLR